MSGWQNLETSFMSQFYTNAEQEFVMSAALNVEWGGTGSSMTGMASHSLRSPSAELPGHLLADGFPGAVVYFSLTCGLLLASALAIALVAPPY